MSGIPALDAVPQPYGRRHWTRAHLASPRARSALSRVVGGLWPTCWKPRGCMLPDRRRRRRHGSAPAARSPDPGDRPWFPTLSAPVHLRAGPRRGTPRAVHDRAAGPASPGRYPHRDGPDRAAVLWGGDGPTNGDSGFDCSGLTTFSYAAAGVGLPRTAHTQYYAGPHVPPGAALQPGDLVFYGTPARVHHVGMYIGDGKMANAPTFGKPVQVAFYRWTGDDYLGATRPAATGSTTGLLPYAPPAPVTPSQPQDFPAPVAPAPTTEPQATAPQPVEALSAAQASAAVVSR